MSFFERLFKKQKRKNPEDDFIITITDKFIKVEHRLRKIEQISWENIKHIKVINTNEGSGLPDVWLALFGIEDGCLIPQGAKGFEEDYNTVSQYEGFNFENFITSMTCTDNAEFDLWTKK
ncbi:MAG: hypothetical protein ACXWWC_09740 [Chitinophagaceae bacterium]